LIFGLVRDETGNPVQADDAEVVLITDAGTKVTAPILTGVEPGLNYKLPVPMDSGIADDLYQPTALRPTLPFRLQVRIGQAIFLPIEMKGDYARMGAPGGRTRIDLTLGEDANGNGLPDAWERALLAQSGGALTEIRPEDDFDGDGVSNRDEYVAGTYAFDPKDGFTLKIVRTAGEAAVLEFMAIRGRTYAVHGSANMREWTPVPFRLPADAAAMGTVQSYYAADVRLIQVEVGTPAEQPSLRFFRLMVQ
jgi:hypothetical protein